MSLEPVAEPLQDVQESSPEYCIDCDTLVTSNDTDCLQRGHELLEKHEASAEKLEHLRQANSHLCQKQWEYETLLQQCNNSKEQLLRNKREVEQQILRRADEMSAIIENHKNHLLDQIKHICDDNLHKYAHDSNVLRSELKNVKAVTKFSSTLINHGTDEDILG